MSTWQCQSCFRFYDDDAEGYDDLGPELCPYCDAEEAEQELVRGLFEPPLSFISDANLKEDEAS